MNKYITPFLGCLAAKHPYRMLRVRMRSFLRYSTQNQKKLLPKFLANLWRELPTTKIMLNTEATERLLLSLFNTLKVPKPMQEHFQTIWWPSITVKTPEVSTSTKTVDTSDTTKAISTQPLKRTVEQVCLEVIQQTPVLVIPEKSNHTINFHMDQSSIYLIMDIEGPSDDPLELSILAIQNRQIIETFHQYALPKHTARMVREAQYCHCISLEALREQTKQTSTELLDQAKAFANKYSPTIVLSNDNTYASDIASIIHTWKIDLLYENVYLGDWRFRTHFLSHRIAIKCKQESIMIGNIVCDSNKIHSTPYKAKIKEGHHNETQLAKLAHGAHCSLYDCVEVYLYLSLHTIT